MGDETKPSQTESEGEGQGQEEKEGEKQDETQHSAMYQVAGEEFTDESKAWAHARRVMEAERRCVDVWMLHGHVKPLSEGQALDMEAVTAGQARAFKRGEDDGSV